jgi:hypothetical protein
MSESRIFDAGLPTEPDVDRLIKELGIPKEGKLLPFAAVAGVIQTEIWSTRFKTVTTAWRKRLWNEYDVHIRCDPGRGFVAGSPTDRITDASGQYKSGLRRIGRSGRLAASADESRLSASDKRVREHLMHSASALRLAAATQAKQLKLSAPQIQP